VKKIISLILCGCLSIAAFAESPDSVSVCRRQTVGLVLSGGGAKGIAHAGVIQALEENGIPIDYIAGTSMGAIVGGLYAAGYTPHEIIELILSEEFESWSTGKINPALTYYYLRPELSPAIVKLDIGRSDTATTKSLLPNSLINPIPMNFGFMEVFSPHTAVCASDFDDLFVPFRCVASDVYNKEKVVLRRGDLGEAIRMSMTFPVAFKPIERNGLPMFDGGIYDNFPVSVMKEEFAPDVIIGVDVTLHEKEDVTNIISQLESMIIQQDDYELPEKDGLKIHVDLKGIGLLDFPKADEIFRKGYEKTESMMDSIKARIKTRVSNRSVDMRRNIYKSKVSKVRFDSLEVEGADGRAKAYIRRIFSMENKDTLTIEEAKDAYYRIVSSGKFRDLVPSPQYEKNGLFHLRLKATTKENAGLGIGGYITSTTNSMAYVSAGYETLALNSFNGEIAGWVGQSYYGGLASGRILMHSSTPTTVRLQGGAFQQKFYEDEVLFFENNTPAFIMNNQYYANLVIGIGIGRHSKLETKVGYGYLRDRFYPDKNVNFSATAPDEGRYRLGQVRVSYDYNTLDDDVYPSSGMRLLAGASGVLGSQRYIGRNGLSPTTDYESVKWAEAEFDIQKYFRLSSRFSFGTRLNVLASTKKLYDSYTASLVQAPAFTPTQSSRGMFIPAFRSNSFVAGGIVPIVRITDNLQLRSEFYAFSPMRRMLSDARDRARYGDWFGTVNFMGEISAVYRFPFASLSLYGNYADSPSGRWNVGVSFGYFITVPKFLR